VKGFEIGKIYPVTEGRDVALFATGVMVSKAVEAADKLKAEGVSVQVLDVATLKPLRQEEVLKYAKGKKAIVTAEEQVKTGGMGEAIASLLLGQVNCGFEQVAINNVFGTSSHEYEELLTRYGLSSDDVYKAVKKALAAGGAQ
jgi:transketolase